MITDDGNSGYRGVFVGRFRPRQRASDRIRVHSSPHLLQQRASHDPQVGQRKQRMQQSGVLGQSPIAHLHMPELALA